jgi:hypothetical protein
MATMAQTADRERFIASSSRDGEQVYLRRPAVCTEGLRQTRPSLPIQQRWTNEALLSGIYFTITSRANLLATISRSSVRFLPASIMASREP